MKEKDLMYKVGLGTIPGVGNKNSQSLLAYCGSAEQVFKSNKQELLKIPGVGENLVKAILDVNTLRKAEAEIENALKANLQLIFFTDSNYPKRLRQIYNAPPLLYYGGNANLDRSKVLAVVGTRKMTGYGKEICEHFISELKNTNILIVSGLAYGVDICAHKAALDNGLETIGVLAGGMDNIYPGKHKNIAYSMMEQGGLLTEERFGTVPSAPKFPARNRIVAGLSDAVLVIESAESGGSLITANMAFESDREVFAVPGSISNPYSVGCNNLIKKQKAHLITSISDLLEEMNWVNDAASPQTKIDLSALSSEEKTLIHCIKEQPNINLDELSYKLATNSEKITPLLLNLEFQGLIEAIPGKKFRSKLFV